MAQEIADSTLLDTWGSSGAKIEPDISKIIEGWQLGEQPPHEYMNWLQNTFGSKLNHILKNGVASWNNTTQYLAGSSVQHNGNVWLCKTNNTNSAPTDANANWKRIITIEALTTVLAGYVKNTGDETIAGVKTFSSFPITPSSAPTSNYQVVNKKYVDDTSGGYTTYGLGAEAILNNSFDSFLDTGFYKQTTGGDSPNNYSSILKIKNAGNADADLLFVHTTPSVIIKARTSTGGTRNSWVELMHSENEQQIGVSQSYQDVTASRTIGVTYTNTTRKAVEVTVSVNGSGSGTTTINGFVNGLLIGTQSSSWSTSGTGTVSNFSMVVPSGATYNITTSGSSAGISMNKWSELR